jgi:hypothetical protein
MQQWNRFTEDTRPPQSEAMSSLEKTRLEAMHLNILSSSTIDSENIRRWAIKARFNSKTKKIPPWGKSLQAYQLAFATTKDTSTTYRKTHFREEPTLENLASTKLRALQIE